MIWVVDKYKEISEVYVYLFCYYLKLVLKNLILNGMNFWCFVFIIFNDILFFFVIGEFGLLEMFIIWMICNGIYIDIVIYV